MDSKYDFLFTFDEPISYKSLKIYPAKLRDYIQFISGAQSLLIDKNSYDPDPKVIAKIISMTYLEYMYWKTFTDMEHFPYLFQFNILLRLVLKMGPMNEKNATLGMDENDLPFMHIDGISYGYKDNKPYFKIGDEYFVNSDFEEIRKIIAEYNMLELINEDIPINIRQNMEEYKRLKQKESGVISCSLEDQIIALSQEIGIEFTKIYDWTIRKFNKSIQRANHVIYWKMYMQGSLSGMVEFKDKSVLQKNWLAKLDTENKMEDYFIDSEKIEGEINQLNNPNAKKD